MDQYYYNWSKTTYPKSKLDDLSLIWTNHDYIINDIILNLAQFTRFYHLEYYDSMINSRRKIYQYLAQLEPTSKEMRQAFVDYKKQFNF